jgi:hypothetical protein
MRSERTDLALQVLIAIHARTFISEANAFQLLSWVSPEEVLLPLEAIALLVLERESAIGTAGQAS